MSQVRECTDQAVNERECNALYSADPALVEMRGGFFHVAQGIPESSAAVMNACVGVWRDGLGEPGAAGDLADDPPGTVSVQPPPSTVRNTGPTARSSMGMVDDFAAVAGDRQRRVPGACGSGPHIMPADTHGTH